MSYYIRTKSSIFEVVDENDLVFHVKAKGNPNNIYSKSKCQTQVIGRSDCISKLLNRYIITKNKKSYKICTKYQFESIRRKEISKRLNNGFKIYGCIWTSGEYDEPVLKPVAILDKEMGLLLL